MNATTTTATTITCKKPFSVNRRTIRQLPGMSRAQLKILHLILTGEQVFGLKREIIEKVAEAIEDTIG